jgi:hypothetical protein
VLAHGGPRAREAYESDGGRGGYDDSCENTKDDPFSLSDDRSSALAKRARACSVIAEALRYTHNQRAETTTMTVTRAAI